MDVLQSCCCCLLRPSELHLRTPYTGIEKTEIYSDMLEECFNINLAVDNDECGICEDCVGRLRDASDFKLLVQRSQAELRERLERAQNVKEEEDESQIKTEVHNRADASDGCILSDESRIKDEMSDNDAESSHGGDQIEYELRPVVSEDEMSNDFKTANDLLECKLETPETSHIYEPATVSHEVKIEHDHKCQVCHKTYATSLKLAIHKRTHDKLNIEYCKKFGREFRKNLGESYICNTCGKQFRRRYNFIRHLQGHDDTKHFSCHVCGKSFKFPNHLREHSRIHTGDKPHSCDICKKTFGQKSAVNVHMRIHTGEKPFKCNVCNKRFAQISGLYTHQLVHTEKKGFVCDICNKEFRQKFNLTAHRRIHTGEKPFGCDICHKQFSERSSLKRHTRVHTGERPYTCEICNAKFREHSSYNRHKASHLGKKPHTCDICNSRFGRKSHLVRHKHTHTGEKPYCCDVCGKRFLEKFSLTLHKKSHSKNKKKNKKDLCESEKSMEKDH